MKCDKCSLEMKLNESEFLFSCKCGNVKYNPDIIVSKIDLPPIEITPIDLSFTCQICGGSQSFSGSNFTYVPILICDKCKKDLKEYVLSKRQNIPE